MGSTRFIRQQLSEKISQRIAKTAETAKTAKAAAQIVAQSAKSQIDQALLGLQHSGLKDVVKKESQDLIQSIGQGVLKRAENIRQQIVRTPFSPSWLKEISLSGPTSSIWSKEKPGFQNRQDGQTTDSSSAEKQTEDLIASENLEAATNEAGDVTVLGNVQESINEAPFEEEATKQVEFAFTEAGADGVSQTWTSDELAGSQIGVETKAAAQPAKSLDVEASAIVPEAAASLTETSVSQAAEDMLAEPLVEGDYGSDAVEAAPLKENAHPKNLSSKKKTTSTKRSAAKSGVRAGTKGKTVKAGMSKDRSSPKRER